MSSGLVGYVPITAYASDMMYWFESKFRDGVAVKRRFGYGQRLSRFEVSREYERVFALGDRRMVAHIPKQFSGRVGVEFILSDPYVFEWLLAPVYDESTSVLSKYVYDGKIHSGEIDLWLGRPGESTYTLCKLKGVVAESLEISVRATELVEASLDARFAVMELSSSNTLPAVTLDEDDGSAITPGNLADRLFTFATASLKIDDDTEVPVRELRFTIENNPELVWVLGSDEAVTAYGKEFIVTGSFTVVAKDTALINKLIDNKEFSALELTLYGIPYKKGSKDTGNSVKVVLGGSEKPIRKVESVSVGGVEAVEAVTIEVSFVANDIEVQLTGYKYYGESQ